MPMALFPSSIPNSPQTDFVTPSHQYPLGSHLSLERRKSLLNLAKRYGSWIVEDDYDSEFRFSGQPYPSLQGLESDAPVIYMGTFSKTIYPALRIGYLVVPKPLFSSLRILAAELYRGGHLLEQRHWPSLFGKATTKHTFAVCGCCTANGVLIWSI